MFNLLDNCSVCISSNSVLIKVSVADKNEVKFSSKLRQCVPEVDWGDDCNICSNCVEHLETAYTFHNLCLQSYEARKQQESLAVKSEQSTIKSEESYDFRINNSIKDEILSPFDEVYCVSSEAMVKKDPLADGSIEKVAQLEIEELDNNDTNEIIEKPTKSKYPKKCDYCSKEFKRKQHLVNHVRTLHTLEKPYACDSCEDRFPTLDKLKCHQKRHGTTTISKRFVCPTCGKIYISSSGFFQHMQSHSNKREYKCDMCDKTFNTNSILGSHKFCVHTDPKLWKYQCTFCEKRFPIKSSFMAHVRRHTGEKNFACHICVKRFVDKDSMINHVRSHGDDRLFKCHLCDVEYKTRKGLSIHLKKNHDIGTIKVPETCKKYDCSECSKTFASASKLEKHRRSHTGEKPFSCLICKKKFTDGWYLKVHLRNKHAQDYVGDTSDYNLDN